MASRKGFSPLLILFLLANLSVVALAACMCSTRSSLHRGQLTLHATSIIGILQVYLLR